VEIGDHANDDPWQTPAEVDEFVHDEAQEAGRKSIVLHPQIPSLIARPLSVYHVWVLWHGISYSPEALGGVQLDIVLGDVVEDAQVVLRQVDGSGGDIVTALWAHALEPVAAVLRIEVKGGRKLTGTPWQDQGTRQGPLVEGYKSGLSRFTKDRVDRERARGGTAKEEG